MLLIPCRDRLRIRGPTSNEKSPPTAKTISCSEQESQEYGRLRDTQNEQELNLAAVRSALQRKVDKLQREKQHLCYATEVTFDRSPLDIQGVLFTLLHHAKAHEGFSRNAELQGLAVEMFDVLYGNMGDALDNDALPPVPKRKELFRRFDTAAVRFLGETAVRFWDAPSALHEPVEEEERPAYGVNDMQYVLDYDDHVDVRRGSLDNADHNLGHTIPISMFTLDQSGASIEWGAPSGRNPRFRKSKETRVVMEREVAYTFDLGSALSAAKIREWSASRTRPSSRRASPTPEEGGNGGGSGASGSGDGANGDGSSSGGGSGAGPSRRSKRKVPSEFESGGGDTGSSGGGGVVAAADEQSSLVS